MLRLMRDKATSWLIKVLLGAIVVVFVFWGVGSFRSERFGRAAVVNGDVVTIDELRNAYNNLIDQLRRRFGNRLDEDMLKALRVKEQALNQLVDNRLLVQEAQNLKFRVSDEELADAIKNYGAFQRAGSFDNQLYNNVLKQLRLTPEQFEASQREAMLVEKLRTLILGSVKVSDQEAREWYNWQFETVDIDFVLFEPDRYENIEPADDAIKAFFEKNKTNYKTEPMVKVRYLAFRPDTYRSQAAVSDDEIRQYYDANPDEFKKPKTIEARHILLIVDPNADTKTVEEKRKQALDILNMARSGRDFAELAKQYSEDSSKETGGYLGQFERESLVKPFGDIAFSMKAGEIGGPVRTQFGWHIIKVEKVNPAATLLFGEAEEKIRKKLIDERARTLAYDQAEAVSNNAFEGDDLVQVANERGLKLLTTDFFTEKGPGNDIGSPAKFAAAAFGLLEKDISDIQEFEEGYYILQVVEKLPPKVPEYENVKDRVRADLAKEMQNQRAQKDANVLLEALKAGNTMDSESRNYKLVPKATGFFKRNDSIPGIGFDRKIIEAAFNLSEAKRLPEDILQSRQGYYVIQFKDRKKPDPIGFGAEEQKIRQALLEQKKAKTFNAYLEQIKSKSEITIKKELLE